MLYSEADPDTGVWPKRDATSPYVIARDRGYGEVVDAIHAAREKRGARGRQSPTESTRKLQQAYQSGSEEAVVVVFDEHPELAEMKWLIDHGGWRQP